MYFIGIWTRKMTDSENQKKGRIVDLEISHISGRTSKYAFNLFLLVLLIVKY